VDSPPGLDEDPADLMQDGRQAAAVTHIEGTIAEAALIEIGGPTEVADRILGPVKSVLQRRLPVETRNSPRPNSPE
jgi:hypothetical protein